MRLSLKSAPSEIVEDCVEREHGRLDLFSARLIVDLFRRNGSIPNKQCIHAYSE